MLLICIIMGICALCFFLSIVKRFEIPKALYRLPMMKMMMMMMMMKMMKMMKMMMMVMMMMMMLLLLLLLSEDWLYRILLAFVGQGRLCEKFAKLSGSGQGHLSLTG